MQTLPQRRGHRLPASAYSEKGHIFSVTISTTLRAPVFAESEFADSCVALLHTVTQKPGLPLFAYCLMPDHVHILIGVKAEAPLARTIGSWKSLCYRERRLTGSPERFWQLGFWDRALRREDDIIATARYILDNPVRAGLVRQAAEWSWSGSILLD